MGVLPAAASRRAVRPTADLWVHVLAALVVGGFVASTIPGVRPHPGYDAWFDGWLNNLAYAMAPALAVVRLRRHSEYQPGWRLLALGLALYGGGNVLWTVFVRPENPQPFPSVSDGLSLSFYPCAFAALVVLLRTEMKRHSLSLWLDGF